MSQTLAVWLLLALALVAANLPFATDRVFGLVAYRRKGAPLDKPFWLRLVELVILYLVAGMVGKGFEASLGNPFAQRWEFYAITFSLFLVLAFPGFVMRYLFRRQVRDT